MPKLLNIDVFRNGGLTFSPPVLKTLSMLIYDNPGTKAPFDKIPTKPEDKKEEDKIKEKTAEYIKRIDDLQRKLYAENKQSLLIVFQGMDGAGKDSVTRRVLGPLNPQGVQVTSFKAPETLDLSHDFLWRVHSKVPPFGQIGIFNRSHYEDVLIVRVKKLIEEEAWQKRYQHINDFERLLTDSKVTILKFYLHISKKEQMERFEERKNTPEKNWKFNPKDYEVQDLWDDYIKAYQAVFENCSTPYAPWHIIPSDSKWYRDYCVAKALLETLEKMDPKYPFKNL